MELKQNVWVYVEVADGKVSPLSAELLGKGRELADARNNTLVGLVVGDEKAAQDDFLWRRRRRSRQQSRIGGL